jgi:hypothetical protein
MDHGDGYESAVRAHLISQRQNLLTPDAQQHRPAIQRARDSFISDGLESSVDSPEGPQSWEAPSSQNSSRVPLAYDPYGYQPYVPEPQSKPEVRYLHPSQPDKTGVPILPTWRRYLITWILAFVSICCFAFTIIFAWNASEGQYADTRLLFEDPGRTILVLQILGTVTTALFGELIVASCEMVMLHIVKLTL